jgi:hypothetical protein
MKKPNIRRKKKKTSFRILDGTTGVVWWRKQSRLDLDCIDPIPNFIVSDEKRKKKKTEEEFYIQFLSQPWRKWKPK